MAPEETPSLGRNAQPAVDNDLELQFSSRGEALRDLGSDFAYVARTIRRSPGFALTVALTLGLGIGAAATMYGVIDRLLLRGPEHIAGAESLRRVYAHVKSKSSGEFTTSTVSYSAYVAMRDRTRSVAAAAAYRRTTARLGRGLDARTITLASTTADFFPLLGARAARGRFFDAAEDMPPDGARVAVVSDGFWTRELGRSDSAIGHTVTINDQSFTVIGVAPSGFTGAELGPVDVWIPVSADGHPTKNWTNTWNAQWLNVIVRLKRGVSPAHADEDVTAAFRASYGGTDEVWKVADVSARPIGLTNRGVERPEASIARWLSAVALVVLLIAAANVMNLLIVRVLRRHHEVAIRLALGISRGRLIRLLVLESSLLALLGAVVSIAIAYGGGEMMRRVLLPTIEWTTSPVSARVLAASIAIALVVGAIIGLAPAAGIFGSDLATSLRSNGPAQTARSSRVRRGLLTVQTAFSVLLLVGAGLFVRSLSNVRGLDLGVQPDRVLVAYVGWPRQENAAPDAAAAEQTRRTNVWKELRETVARLPGVGHAALAVGTPFGNGFGEQVKVPGRDTMPSAPGGGPYISAVGADYFATAGTSLVRGRAFGASDGAGTPLVAIVNETMASLVWPGEDAMGKCIMVEETPCATVVGVVRDARRSGIRELSSMQFYIPFGQESGFGGTALLVRPTGDTRAFIETLRRSIASNVHDANVVSVSSMQDAVDPQVRPWRLGATMFGLFGAVALIVAAVGLYSTIAYGTAQRTREFGVRLAVGASQEGLLGIVLLDGMRMASFGLLIGGVVALFAGARVAPLLFNVSPRDPVVFAGVALVMLLTAVVASLVPAWRAARTDPMVALRAS